MPVVTVGHWPQRLPGISRTGVWVTQDEAIDQGAGARIRYTGPSCRCTWLVAGLEQRHPLRDERDRAEHLCLLAESPGGHPDRVLA